MLDNVRRKRSQISIDLYKSVLLRLYAFSPKVLKLDLGKLRLVEKATKSFRYFGQGHLFSSEVCSIKNVEFKMLECSADTFEMGHEDQGNDNKPRPEIVERPFILGETEVTQELYQVVMDTNPSKFKNRPQNPVECVSWYDAILFCNKLSELQGLEECYILTDISTIDEYGVDQERIMSAKVICGFGKSGYRLPTEKEWEYAAKAGTQNKYAGTDNVDELENYAVYDKRQIFDKHPPHPVKSKLPNSWGFYDMGGNVQEWCWDKYGLKDPDTSAERVFRGGGWSDNDSDLRSTHRGYNSPGNCFDAVGFRVCRSIVN